MASTIVLYRLTLPGQTGTIAVGTAIAARFETMRSRAKSFIVFATLATAAGVVTPGVASAGNDVSSFSLPLEATSPADIALALERRIVSGEGAVFPDPDIPVVLDFGAVDVSAPSWPQAFRDIAGAFAFLAVSPSSGMYEFSDSEGNVFWSLAPTVPLTGNWVASFRRATSTPSALDPLFAPSRIVFRFFPHDGDLKAALSASSRRKSNLRRASAISPATHLQFSAFEVLHGDGALRFTADWPDDDCPPDGLLDLYHTPQIDPLSWHRVASFKAESSPVSFSLPWPALYESPLGHVHDGSCVSTTNILVSPLDGSTVYTNVIWACSAPRPKPVGSFFRLGTRHDTDGDGLPDALEALALGTNPDSPEFGPPDSWPSVLADGLLATPFSPPVSAGPDIPQGTEILSRTFPISPNNGWKQYFVSASASASSSGTQPPLPVWNGPGARISWSDDRGQSGILAEGSFTGALRIPVSPDATTVTLTLSASGTGSPVVTGAPLFLLDYEPVLSFPSASSTKVLTPKGDTLVAVMHSDALFVFVDRSARPVTAEEQISEEEAHALPFAVPPGATADSTEDGGIVIRNLPCGAYPWPVAAQASSFPLLQAKASAINTSPDKPAKMPSSGTSIGGSGTLYVIDPTLIPLCAHTLGQTAFSGGSDFPDSLDYPFEERCLRAGFMGDAAGAPNCGGVISLGMDDSPHDAMDCGSRTSGSFFHGDVTTEVIVNGDTINGCVFVGGQLFWESSVPHSTAQPPDSIPPEKLLTSYSEDSCDDSCATAFCASGECDQYDGPSLGSLRFRVSLGETRAGQHSGFLYLDEESLPPTLTPEVFRLRHRHDAAIADHTENDGTRTVTCYDDHGRTLTVVPCGSGSEIAISLTDTGEKVGSWRIERTSDGARFRRLALNGDAMRDETVSQADGDTWMLADSVAGTVETLSLPEHSSSDSKTERRTVRDVASGAVLSDVWTSSAAIKTPSGTITREVSHSLEHSTGSWSDSYAGYCTDNDNPARDGLPLFVRKHDGSAVHTDYDTSGRLVVRSTSRIAGEGAFAYNDNHEYSAESAAAGANSVIELFGYETQPGDSAAAEDANVPRDATRYLHEPYAQPIMLSREWTTIERGIPAPFGTAVRVRTERAAAADSAPGDPENAVSFIVRFDETSPGVPLILRGAPMLEADENGIETRYDYAFGSWDSSTLAFTPSSSASAPGAFIRTRILRAPHSAQPNGIPGVSTVEETIRDATLGMEVFAATRAMLSGGELSEPFGWQATERDDRNRITLVRYHDGTASSNEWSCCRLLASTDRTGARTLRSSSPALTRMYFAEEPLYVATLPHSDKFLPYESQNSHEADAIGVTQHWFDGYGRETNVISRCDLVPGASANPSRTRSNGTGWFATNSVAYPVGDSRLSVETDARGVRTRRVLHIDPESGASIVISDTYAPGVLTDALVKEHTQTEDTIPNLPSVHSLRTETRIDGSSIVREEWDGGAVWVETQTDTLYEPDGGRTERTAVTSSDGASDAVSMMRYDMLGRLVETDSPADRRILLYCAGSMRPQSESNLLSGAVSEPIYDEAENEIGTSSFGVSSEMRTTYALDQEGALWRVSRSAVFSGVLTNSWVEAREQMTALAPNVLSRTEIVASSGETVTTTVERESATSDIRRETKVSNVTGTVVRRTQYGRIMEETSSQGTTYHYFDAFGRSFTTDRSNPGETAKTHRTWTGRNQFGDIEEADEFWRVGSTDAAVFATFFAYDSFGNVISCTNALGAVAQYAYDQRGRKLSENGTMYPARYSYDSAGRRTSLCTTRSGDTWDETAFVYDSGTGRRKRKAYADGSVATFTHTPDGLPLRTTLPSGRWTETVYDERRNAVALNSSDGTIADTFEYDVFGHETSTSNAAVSTRGSRDLRGNVTNEEWTVRSDTFSLERRFDAAGRLASIGQTTYGFDEDGKINAISNALFFVKYAYAEDRADAGSKIELPNGTSFSREIQRSAYRRTLVTNIVSSANGDPVETFAYAYDALGRPTSRNADSFGYNARGEVIFSRRGAEDAEDTEDTYAYDNIGNLLSFASPTVTNVYTANELNQYTTISAKLGLSAPLREINPAYDTDGNMTADGTFSYAYDSACRLTSISSNGICVTAFAYDAKGRRVRKETSATTHTYFYDDWNLIEERIACADGTTSTNRYYWGKDISGSLQGAGGIGGLLAVSIDGTPYFPFYDNNGNITRYLDSTGATVATYTYDAFGRTLSATGPLAGSFPHRFSTKYFDTETGLYYYGYRYYSPALMRWLTRDPIEEKGGMNIYTFCGNCPVYSVDPLGALKISGFINTSNGLSYLEGGLLWYLGKGSTIHVPVSKLGLPTDVLSYFNPCDYRDKPFSQLRHEFDTFRITSYSGWKYGGPGRVAWELSGDISWAGNSGRCWKFSGEVSVRDDRFDFDPRPWGERPYFKEAITRAIRGTGGTDFNVTFDGNLKIVGSGICQ